MPSDNGEAKNVHQGVERKKAHVCNVHESKEYESSNIIVEEIESKPIIKLHLHLHPSTLQYVSLS